MVYHDGGIFDNKMVGVRAQCHLQQIDAPLDSSTAHDNPARLP
jgi:hypothetical protein